MVGRTSGEPLRGALFISTSEVEATAKPLQGLILFLAGVECLPGCEPVLALQLRAIRAVVSIQLAIYPHSGAASAQENAEFLGFGFGTAGQVPARPHRDAERQFLDLLFDVLAEVVQVVDVVPGNVTDRTGQPLVVNRKLLLFEMGDGVPGQHAVELVQCLDVLQRRFCAALCSVLVFHWLGWFGL